MTESANSTHAPSRQKLNGATPPPRPRRKPLRINRQRRERMEEIVDGLLRLLDEVDGDSDEEPSLGYTPPGYAIDAEGEDDDGIADVDGMGEQLHGEPSLGWTHARNQAGPKFHGRAPWGSVEDGEEEHDGREPDEDREPSLGSLENHASTAGFFMGRDGRGSQVHWADGRSDDREPDGDELDGSFYIGEALR